PPPRDLARHLEPLGVLVEHRVHDVHERLVGVEDTVTAGEEISLQPALALVLAQDLHDAALGRQVVIAGDPLGEPLPLRGFEHGAQAVTTWRPRAASWRS